MKNIFLIILVCVGIICGCVRERTLHKRKIVHYKNENSKFREFYGVLTQWVELKQAGKSLEEYFEHYGYRSVAIYGMKELGELLYDELKESKVEIKYVIDKNIDYIYTEVPGVKPDEPMEMVDVVVVAAISYFPSIKKDLEKKVDCPIVSLADMITEI